MAPSPRKPHSTARRAGWRGAPLSGLLALLLLLLGPGAAAGQADEPTRPATRGELRLGVSVGGTGFVGFITEYRRGGWSGELNVGTISFREISVSVVGKRYFGTGTFQPAIGAGIWSLSAWTEDGSGSILLARVPLAVDWHVTGGHHLGLEVAMNRALVVNRLDPEDDTPPSRTIVPLPGLYYRYGWVP
jgi:hypothetical protein